MLGLIFLKNGIDDREKVESFYQENMIVDVIPLIENTLPQRNLASETHQVDQRENNSFTAQTDYRTIDPTSNNIPQRLDRSSSKLKFSKDDTNIDSQRNATTRPALPTPNPLPQKKLIPTKAPALAETAFFEKTTSQEVENTKIILPMSKPRVTADFQRKNQILKKSFEADNNSTPQFSITSQLRDKNTTALEAKISDIRGLKHEFIPELDLSKNAKFSIDEMLKQRKSKNPFQSLQAKPKTGIAKHQCKLVTMQKKKTKINIRSIQNQIRSRSITISNILTDRSLQKSNEISISSLLASDLNTSSQNLQRQPDNIGFLMTFHSLQYPAENLVCETN